MVDLIQLCERLVVVCKKDPAIVKAATEVAKAARAVIAEEVHGRGRPNLHGLSITFPSNLARITDEEPEDHYFAMRQATRLPWSAMVKSFCEKLDTKESKPVLGEVRASARSVTDGRNVTFSGTLDAENVDLSWFVVTKAGTGDRDVVSSVSVEPDEDGALEWEWDGAVPVLEAGRGQVMIVTRTEAVVEEDADQNNDDKKGDDNETDASTAAQVWIKRSKSDWRLGWLFFDADLEDEDRMLLVDAIVIEPASGSERPWKLKKGDRLKPVRPSLNGNMKLAMDLKKPRKDWRS